MEINTKRVVEAWKEELELRCSNLEKAPILEIIVAPGYSSASTKYVSNKLALAKDLGIETVLTEVQWEGLDNATIKQNLIKELKESGKSDVNGVIVQLPFPGVTEEEISHLIPAHKDVDGFTDIQKLKLINNEKDALVPCTAKGVMKILHEVCGNDLSGKSIAIVNRSNLIGMPLFHLALHNNMTPMICHSKTQFIDAHFKIADIIVTGCGRRKIYSASNFAFNPTIIDCSMTLSKEHKGVGDCDKEDILSKKPGIKIASGYGHTGPMTVCALMDNVIQAYLQQGGR